MNHAFLITAHKQPELLERIIASLSADNHFIFVNVDRKSGPVEKFAPTRHYPNVIFMDGKERMAVQHGAYSQVACTLRMLKRAMGLWPRIDYFHLMSGQDYMCASPEKFDDFFEAHPGQSFMFYDSDEEVRERQSGYYRTRMTRWNLSDLTPFESPFMFFVRKQVQKVAGILIPRKAMPDVYGGWNWFSWHRSVAEFVLDQERENPRYFNRFHFTSGCDELIFHTLLHPYLKQLRIEQYNSLRFLIWTPPLTSPLTLEEKHYDSIVKSGAFFCRKVDPRKSAALLAKLDRINGIG